MWVQLRAQKQIPVKGKPTAFYPGDWVNVGRQTAQGWIAAGEAVLPPARQLEILPDDAGLVLTGQPGALARLEGQKGLLSTVIGPPSLPWRYTCIWDGVLSVPPAMIPSGLGLLDRWQVAVPVLDYGLLAANTGTEEDRALTAAVLPDLRVPVYASGLLFVRRCEETMGLLEAWAAEPGDRDLAFLRALYTRPLLMLGLPTVWVSKDQG